MFRSAATKLAHNSTIPALGANSDLRPLQDLILAEKQVLNSLQKLSSDLAKNAEALRVWGSGEGDDLGDILGASATLLALWATSISQFSAHEHPMRDNLKAIRTREENLDDLKRRRKSVGAKAEAAERKLSKMAPENKNLLAQTDSLNALRAEIRSMDSEIMTEEAALGDFKRTMTRTWMGLKFGALLECSEKGTIAAEYGKLIIGEIVEEQTQPGMSRSLYYGRQKTEQLLSEAHRCIDEVRLSTVPVNPNPPRAFQQSEQQSMQPDLQSGLGMQGPTQLPVNPPQSAFNIPGLTSQTEWQPQPQPQPRAQPPNLQSQNTDDQYHHLPVPQGLGTGQFLEHPEHPASFNFDHQRFSSQSTLPGSPHHAIDGHPAPPRSVDDFGVNTNSFGHGQMDPSGQGGSRFATFPANHRNYNLTDPQAPAGQENESFSMAVAQAMSASHGSPGTVPSARLSYEPPPAQRSPQLQQGHPLETAMQGGPPGVPPSRLSYGLPPAQRSPQLQQGHPLETAMQGGPPGNAPSPRLSYELPPAQRSPLLQQSHPPEKAMQGPSGHLPGRLSLHHDARDAYSDDEVGLAYDYLQDDAPSPRARAGMVQDVDPRLETRSGRSNDDAAHNPEHHANGSQDHWSAVSPSQETQPPEYEAIPHLPEVDNDSHIPQSVTQPADRSSMTDTRFQHQRRIPPPVFDPTQEERLLNAAAAREVSREMDALTFNPPIPQQDRERTHSVAKGDHGYRAQPNISTGEQLAPPSAPYSGAPSPNTDSPVLPYSSYNATSRTTDHPLPYPSGPTQQQPNHPSMDFQPATPMHSNDGPPRLPPLATQLPSSSYSNPNTASGEYPRSLGAFPGPAQKSTSSLTASGPPGARTISAAAFKRPQRVVGSDSPSTMSDVNPLSIKKRIPSSPYPHGREGSPSHPSRSGSPAQPPVPPPSQALPPVPKDEDSYDYISAYVDSGAPQEATAPRERKQSGSCPSFLSEKSETPYDFASALLGAGLGRGLRSELHVALYAVTPVDNPIA
ncbi:hypothetical protein C0992_006261 [Termitomyces sp. T32_za158]|nr:hypothetical protein C0992_006261 [Termitomyces sp. T32_za158]